MHEQSIEQRFGLPGLRVLREACGIPAVKLAESIGLSYAFYKRIENGKADCSLAVLRCLSMAIGCYWDDLRETPSPEKIQEIRSRYLRAAADLAEADLAS